MNTAPCFTSTCIAEKSGSWIEKARATLRECGSGMRVLRDVPLSGRTYLGIGGPAPVFLVPEDPVEVVDDTRLISLDQLAKAFRIPFEDRRNQFLVRRLHRPSLQP